jgi:hypothetical protein
MKTFWVHQGYLALFACCTVHASCELSQADLQVQPSNIAASCSTADCSDAFKYNVSLCIEADESLLWAGLWDECFNLGTQTTWDPANGLIRIRSKWRLCKKGFDWRSVQYQCPVPTYDFSVEKIANYWVATIQFTPNECLAETVPNCYEFLIYGNGCPF